MSKYLNYVTGNSTALRFNGVSIGLCDINRCNRCNEPLIIYDQYGWTKGGRPTAARVVFPPFSDYTVIQKGDISVIGRYSFISDDVAIGLFKYILDDPGIVEDLDFYVKHRIINRIIYDYGWTYHYDFDKKEDQYFNRKTSKVVVGLLNVIKLLDLDREWYEVASRISNIVYY